MQSTTSVRLKSPAQLSELIKKRGSSLRKLAAGVGLSPGRIGQLTTGKDLGVRVTEAVAIAAALDVDVADLFEFPDGALLVKLGLIQL